MNIRLYDTRTGSGDKGALKQFLLRLEERREQNMSAVEQTVAQILDDVKTRGDAALLAYTRKFDGADFKSPEEMCVTREEMEHALRRIPSALRDALQNAAANIREFHVNQVEKSWFSTRPGVMLGQIVRPLQSAGIYIPAGKAPLPSTVLMCSIPARVAGVPRVVLVTPPRRDGTVDDAILAAACIAKADCLYKVGGAQAVAALAFGTSAIPAVDKVAGPGSIWVNAAKRQVFGYCGIDMFAGPSEVAIIADDIGIPEYIAADMLSQAEHDALSSSVLVTVSERIAMEVTDCLAKQLESLPKRETARASLNQYGAVLLVNDLQAAVDAVNRIAPEHLEICTRSPLSLVDGILNAGAVFLGNYSPEPLGDYLAGPSHTLPTSGTGRFGSPLGVYDFVRRSSLIQYDREALLKVAGDVETLALAEGLSAHAVSARIRTEPGPGMAEEKRKEEKR